LAAGALPAEAYEDTSHFSWLALRKGEPAKQGDGKVERGRKRPEVGERFASLASGMAVPVV